MTRLAFVTTEKVIYKNGSCPQDDAQGQICLPVVTHTGNIPRVQLKPNARPAWKTISARMYAVAVM